MADQEPQEEAAKRPRILWPAANEKEKWQALEDRVKQKYRKWCDEREELDVKDCLVAFADTIYEVASDEFGCGEGKKKPEKKGGPSRRQRDLAQLRKEKRELRKQWKAAKPEEAEGLRVLFEDIKKRSRDLQRIERRHRRRKESKREREQFLKNPYEAAKKLFTEARSGKLKCSKDELDTHVRDTYSDPLKNEPMPEVRGLKRPTAPGIQFNLGLIDEKEVDDFVKKARAKSAPGGDGVSYKVFKYCKKLRDMLHNLLKMLWEERELVEDWCKAEGVYLPKEQNAERIGQFRPISIINVVCKIFMGILAKRTVAFLQNNGYVDESVQKAGIPGIPGCVEHAYSIWDEIQKAKQNKSNLNVVWLDLANAYGSVPHVLLMKAMDFFYIPEDIQEIMRKYYSMFQMRFSTEDFTTEWHRLEIGIAAGCTISVIWFILVMEMLLRATDFSEEEAKVKAPKKAFMDDVTLITTEGEVMDKVLSRLDELVTWSRMKFKAKKSRSVSLKNGKQSKRKFKIAGEVMPTIEEEPVKSLGRWYEGSLSDKSRGVQIMKQAEDGLRAIDKTKLPGKYKIWCLQFALYPRLSWPLMMYEVAVTRVDQIQMKCNIYIRKWLGLPRILNTTALYRQCGALQLPLTSITEVYKAGKIRTVMMLKESNDPEIRGDPPSVKTGKLWQAEAETNKIISALEHRDMVGAAQSDRKGLGNGDFRPFRQMSQKDRRAAATTQVRKIEAEQRELHLIQCSQQGQVTQWESHVVERKIGWSEIWNWQASRLSFLLKSTYDVLPSPVNLKRWKIQEDDTCRCGKLGTMKHILSCCPLALSRYTWRHNKVLQILFETASSQVEESMYASQREPQGHGTIKVVSGKMKEGKINFVPEGKRQTKRVEEEGAAVDKIHKSPYVWEVAADLEGCERFFPIPTSKRPDLVVWCAEVKQVHLIELTVPHEDNIQDAHERKEARYEELLRECEEADWRADYFPVEVGCRGFIAPSLRKWMNVAGLSLRKGNVIMRLLQETVEKASHWIWLKRDDGTWTES